MTIVVDSATNTLLEQIRSGGGKPLYEMTVAEVRATVTGSSQALAGPRIEVRSVVDRMVPIPNGDLPVRVYTPMARQTTPYPVVVYFHGGGFVAGDLDTHDGTARYLCEHAGVVVVSVDYRRPPEHKFPAALDDARAAVDWVASHAGELGADGSRLAVAGDSAGGNLATVVAQMARDGGGPRIAFQALFYPLVDFTLAASPSRAQFGGGDYFLSNRDMEWFREQYLDDPMQASDPRVSPLLSQDLTGMPSTLIVAAECDPLTDEGRTYADRLSAAGVPVEYRCFGGTIHAFMSFAAVIPLGNEALAFTASRLRDSLTARG